MIESKTCILVTAFTKGQPGFLDFSYRIKSLAMNYRLTIVSSFELEQAELQMPNINYLVINTGNGRLGELSYLWRCALMIRRQQPDVVVLLHSIAAPIAMLVGCIPTITYWNEHPTHVAPMPAELMSVKTILRAAIRWMMYRGARQSTIVMPIGEAHRDDLLAHGCLPERTRLMYMGVDKSFSGAALSGISREKGDILRLIYVGTVHKNRGRDVMLEAMAIANKGNNIIAHLSIVGADEEQLIYCQEVVQRLRIQDSVTIYGRVPGARIPEFFQKADVGICLWEDLPWFRFNPPTKLFEYLVAGLPVLASNIPTHTKYVQNSINGLIFEYGSAGLAEAIKQLWQTQDQLPKMKLQAINSSTGYHWDAIEPLFLKAVNEVAR
jgi:glycosyltransferase involved in cell wall biosynthesis